MNVTTFFAHWKIKENPFAAEEARQDSVFARLREKSEHPDYPKILGDPANPATSIVFGEKGSGKTAIRLQLEQAVQEHNEATPDARTLVVAYDDLNPILDRFVRNVPAKSTAASLEQLRLVDHIDGLLSTVTPKLIDDLLDAKSTGILGENAIAKLRQLSLEDREKWLILQGLYDRSDRCVERQGQLRRALRYFRLNWSLPLRKLSIAMLVAFAVCSGLYRFYMEEPDAWTFAGLLALGTLTVLAGGRSLIDSWQNWALSHKLCRQLRVLDRSELQMRALLNKLPKNLQASAPLPIDDLDDPRYRLLEILQEALRPFGIQNVLILIDRVDEPTLVNGEADLMKALIWPFFNNKFLQQKGLAFKMMLPMELRHELHRQSSEFFQEARMDKQNLIDRLSWSGSTLYDLCATRLQACSEDSASMTLTDLFSDDVTRQDVVDALDQMRQPRDAFKMMYQVIQEHCSNTTDEEQNFQIPKLILEQVRRQQVNRLDALQRGHGPA